jgi:hypothetical protein
MDDVRIELNGYLFLEFGIDGDESRVSEKWPFELRKLVETPDLTVFGFDADDEAYFALAGQSLSFLSQADMTVDDLRVQLSGADWIRSRDPVDLSAVRLGDPAVPSGLERRRHLETLATATIPSEAVEILEGLFLCSEQRYVGLFGRSGAETAVIGGLSDTPPIVVPFPGASPWRRLAWGVGQWLMRRSA